MRIVSLVLLVLAAAAFAVTSGCASGGAASSAGPSTDSGASTTTGGGGGAGGGGWTMLGQKRVNFRADRDVIPVTGMRGDFTKIRLKVEGNRINLLDLKIHFRNGGTQDVAVRKEFAAGSFTRVIDLRGDDRVIRKITLIYKTDGRAGRGAAHVKVFGRR